MNLLNPTPRQAVFELLFAAALWGFGFVATQWALTTWNPVGLLSIRFALAFLLGEFLYLIVKRVLKTSSPWQTDFRGSIPAGLLLGSFLLLQTIGLQYTSATKSGFITTLYVIFVPLMNWLLFRKKLSARALFLVALACVGTFLLMDMKLTALMEKINKGDLWTLVSAVIAAGHIIYIGRFSRKITNPFRVNNFQSLWALVIILPAALVLPNLQHSEVNGHALTGLLTLAAVCSVLGFFIQVRTQKVLSDTTASMLFLLESPFAFFFAFFLTGDRLNSSQLAGALLILCAALGMVLVEQNAGTSKVQSK